MEIKTYLEKAHAAVRAIARLKNEEINTILTQVADALVANTESILSANAKDLSKIDASDYRYDRLRLSPERIKAIAGDMRNVASLPSPRRILEKRTLPNGLEIERIAVPFGVIGVIYEARPNVSADVFSLCLKSGNVCVLKGGHDAEESNIAIVGIIQSVLQANNLPENAVTLLPATREATAALLKARGLVDVIIPRGSKSLIENVRANASVPVIETGAGVCHCYVESSANEIYATDIVTNAKTRRVSVCNALDCLLIDKVYLNRLAEICKNLVSKNVIINADDLAFEALKDYYPSELLRKADEKDFGTEFLGYEMAVKTVNDIEEAIEHIDRYGSGHSECIVTDNAESAAKFKNEVDAACVYVNAPTSFTDGAQFGLGAEIGISTQKLHARGPMALNELMTYKWLITGEGQTRP